MTALPVTMIAIDPEGAGGPELLVPVERPVPAPGPREYLINVAAAGVNRPDLMQRVGLYPPPPGAPSIPGLEIAGTIVAAGEGADPSRVGTRICALVAGGGYAQYCAAPAGTCLPLPTPLSMIAAAAVPESFFTVWANLFGLGRPGKGNFVLVHGGSSGIGTSAILLGKAFGLRVIVTSGTPDKCARAEALGAHAAIDYNRQDFVEEICRITGGKGVAVVLDMIGGDYLPRNLACLADEGRHVSIAVQRGPKAELPLIEVMRRRLVLTGSTLRPRPIGFKAALAEEIGREVWPRLQSGAITPVIDSVFVLADAADAHRRLESGAHFGKIVLEVE